MTKHRISHVELVLSNKDKGSQFYADLFGWDVQTVQPMDYVIALMDEGQATVGFVDPQPEQGMPVGGALIYVMTDDIEATLAKARELGGTIIMPKMNIPDVGSMAIIGDPGNNRLAVMQPISR